MRAVIASIPSSSMSTLVAVLSLRTAIATA